MCADELGSACEGAGRWCAEARGGRAMYLTGLAGGRHFIGIGTGEVGRCGRLGRRVGLSHGRCWWLCAAGSLHESEGASSAYRGSGRQVDAGGGRWRFHGWDGG